MRSKVGILTWHQYDNFGSMLQAYALQKTIERMDMDCEIIDYYDLNTIPAPSKLAKAKFLIKKLLMTVGLNRYVDNYFSFQRFYYDKQKKSVTVTNDQTLKGLAKKYQYLVFGSDQIWAPNVFNPVYMGDFAEGLNVRLVSYAASIGLNDIPETLRPVYSRLLSRFSAIAVREEMGKQLLEEQCGISAEVVLDPTLLLNKEEYRQLQRPVQSIEEPYVFCYFLNKDHQYRERVEKYAQKHGYKVYGFSLCEQDKEWMELLPATGPEEFLWLVNHAHTIFTDSYHGTIFSIKFHKDFWTFERFASSDPVCQNSRIQQLDRALGVGKRFLPLDREPDEDNALDYESIDRKWADWRNRSLSYLQEALK